MLPHNLARHLGCALEILENKTAIVMRQAQVLGSGTVIKPHTDDIIELSDDDLAGRCDGAALMIDATADPLVRSRLSRWRKKDIPILRSEIFHKGRLGVHLLTRTASPQSLNCLYYQTVLYAFGESWIREWLAYEATRTFREEELLIGFGCASQTTALPKYKVDAHASTAFALARTALDAGSSARSYAGAVCLNSSNKASSVAPMPAKLRERAFAGLWWMCRRVVSHCVSILTHRWVRLRPVAK